MHWDLFVGKVELVFGDMDLIFGKVDLVFGDRDLVFRKVDLIFGEVWPVNLALFAKSVEDLTRLLRVAPLVVTARVVFGS